MLVLVKLALAVVDVVLRVVVVVDHVALDVVDVVGKPAAGSVKQTAISRNASLVERGEGSFTETLCIWRSHALLVHVHVVWSRAQNKYTYTSTVLVVFEFSPCFS